ncbi:serine/threonine-protein kinase [Gemmatimonadota bacterium]
MIGRTIGHYTIEEVLGRGGMGTVYRARDENLDRAVAIKALASEIAGEEEARTRFIREAQATSVLNHPNITTVHDLIEHGGEYYICMEYVDGVTLQNLVGQRRPAVKEAVDIIMQAADALGTAHEQGILHRDIKSANIMVTGEGRSYGGFQTLELYQSLGAGQTSGGRPDPAARGLATRCTTARSHPAAARGPEGRRIPCLSGLPIPRKPRPFLTVYPDVRPNRSSHCSYSPGAL